jgi:hypothetical protein
MEQSIRWMHLTRPAASTKYSYIFDDPVAFYKQVIKRIGYLDAIVMVGGLTTSQCRPRSIGSLLMLQPFGMAPSLHVLPNEHDEEHFPVLQSPFRRSEPWWCRALCSDPDRLQDGGLMSFLRADDAMSPLEYGLKKQGRFFSRCLVAAPPVPPAMLFASMTGDGLSPSCVLTSGGQFQGMVALLESPSKSCASVENVPGVGYLAHVPDASICEIASDGTMSVWPIEGREISEIGRGRVEVGRLVHASPDRDESLSETTRLLEETFPSDGRLHEFALTYFPQVGRKFTNTMGRQKRLQLILASVPHEHIRAAVMKERRAREAW